MLPQIMTDNSVILGNDNPELIRDTTLPQVFSAACTLHGKKAALIYNDVRLTYNELDQKSNAVAAWLYSKGIGPGAVVGVWLNRGLDLHICILGILKSGAAYIPFDKEMPAERLAVVLEETNAKGYFSEADGGLVTACFIPAAIYEDAQTLQADKHLSPSPNDTAYIIYTSGSTGKPKGIPITHKQICHLLASENSILQITDTDIVYQGFSVSFDMWLEETWISFFAGATLVISDSITAKSFDSLHLFLNKHKVTVLHAVPSLLAMMDTNVPSLRLIKSGGEMCTVTVQQKWCDRGILVYNTYGPTETTVTASCSPLYADTPITIGYPLPNYSMAIVNDALEPLPVGEKGELVISGLGLSNGYINRPDLTAAKFRHKPSSLAEMYGDKIYLSGDIGYIDEDGRVCIAGRMDDQVKLRGYRIELGEIESVLNRQEYISQSVVLVKKINGTDSLVAFVLVEEEQSHFDEKACKQALALALPAYMLPARIIVLKDFPRLPSGKINKHLLPFEETLQEAATPVLPIDESASLEDKAVMLLTKLFPEEQVSVEKDFFDGLGGYSLLAAYFVSEMREKTGIENLSTRDVYTYRPVSNLLGYWKTQEEQQPATAIVTERYKVRGIQYYACWLAQTVALIFIYALLAAQIFVPYLGYYYLQQESDTHFIPILFALLLFCVVPVVQTVLSIALKWLVIGKMKEGDYPLWGTYYFRWWFTRKLIGLVQVQVISGTPLFNNFLNLLGARIAKDAQLSNFSIGAEDLLEIGANVTISSNVVLNNAWVEDGYLKLRQITIMENGYVGTTSVVEGGCMIKAGGELGDLSALGKEKTIEENWLWSGSPAVAVVQKEVSTDVVPVISNARSRRYRLLFFALIFIFPFAVLVPLLPTIITLNKLDDNAADYDFTYMVLMPVLSFAYIMVFIALVVILSRWLQRKVRPGRFPVYSLFYVKKWLADQLLSLSLTVLHPIYASVYVSWFFRLLGAKVGKNTEISTASNVTHKLFSIGDEAFIADAVTLGESDIRNQELILAETSIGNKTFIGNSALVPQGCDLGSNMLVGVLSIPPTPQQEASVTTKDWLGSPAMALPKRQVGDTFAASLTYAPPLWRKLARGGIEFIRIVLPQTVILCLSVLFIAYAHDLLTTYSVGIITVLFPFYYLGIVAIPAFIITVVLKWLVVGKYKEEQLPMWTGKVWRSEGVTTLYEALAVPFLLNEMTGTPWLPLLLKLLGVKTGKRVWMNTADVTEYDMVKIGDYSELNFDSGPQTHLFEDRIMKIGHVLIGKECTIGTRSIVLYDTNLGDNTTIGSLSLVMKGETLPPGTSWAGSPVVRMG
ncbi:MAG: amino acid adenylation domain-containing protein [Filimonas sp.]|nr:amino acid adenylation domain-containing protein [Filimonas sp.]